MLCSNQNRTVYNHVNNLSIQRKLPGIVSSNFIARTKALMLHKHIFVSYPSFRYTFGNGGTPFYTALKEQSERNMYPWQWHNMKQKYSYARSVINLLTNEKYYEFTLTGQFEDVHGVRADLQWKNLNRKRGLPEWEPALEYDLPEEDPERVFPSAPKVWWIWQSGAPKL